MSNREFAATNEEFRAACAELNITPSARQAGKFRHGHGAVYRLVKFGITQKYVPSQNSVLTEAAS